MLDRLSCEVVVSTASWKKHNENITKSVIRAASWKDVLRFFTKQRKSEKPQADTSLPPHSITREQQRFLYSRNGTQKKAIDPVPHSLLLFPNSSTTISEARSRAREKAREHTEEDTARSTSWRSGTQNEDRNPKIHSLVRNPCYGNPKIRIFEKELKWMRNFKPLCNRLSSLQSRVWRIWLMDPQVVTSSVGRFLGSRRNPSYNFQGFDFGWVSNWFSKMGPSPSFFNLGASFSFWLF
jgi:hypothetical protein